MAHHPPSDNPGFRRWNDPTRLTERERTILHLSEQGLSVGQIAVKLGIGVSTVRGHLNRALHKEQARLMEEEHRSSERGRGSGPDQHSPLATESDHSQPKRPNGGPGP